MPRTRIKICGITRPQDAEFAAHEGADAIGLNFFDGPRKIDYVQGEAILQQLSDHVIAVGLVWIDYFQDKRGNQGPADSKTYCVNRLAIRQAYGLLDTLVAKQSFEQPIVQKDVWLPVQVSSRESIRHICHLLGITKLKLGGILFDAASKSGELGGTGERFNWNLISESRKAGELDGLPPIILAGGLTPENVGEAIRIVRPYAVDVSSGVEVAGKAGVKDPAKVRDFIAAVRAADG